MLVGNGKIVVVTGATGVLGSHVVKHLLEAGYTVRCANRPKKAANLRSIFPDAGDKLEIYEVPDVVTGDYSAALKGAYGLIHCAAPSFFGGSTNAEILAGGADGTVNVVKQAIKAGVKKIIATSSFITLFDSDFTRAFSTEPLTPEDWNSVTRENLNVEALPAMAVYIAAKTIGEREFWAIADKNPNYDFTTIVPPAIYGSILPTFPRPAEISGLASLGFIYELLTCGPDRWPDVALGNGVHVTDVARAHVLALEAPPLRNGRHKRLLVSYGTDSWPRAAEFLRKERPELSSRLPRVDVPPIPQTVVPLDTSLAEQVLGITSWILWEQTLLDSVDSVLAWEKGGATA